MIILKGSFVFLVAFCFSSSVSAASLSVNQILSRVLNYHPSLKVAMLELESARQEGNKVSSRLGWQLAVGAGVRHDVSLFGSPNDVIDADAKLSRQLASGETLSLSAGLAHTRADTSLSPTFPNPSTNTSLDINYRIPLQKGKANLSYHQALADTDHEVRIKQTALMLKADLLAQQIVDLYYALAANEVRLGTGQRAIERTQRLMKYIDGRTHLGVSEAKDVLQVQAQLKTQQAQQQHLHLLLSQQKIALNRLMGSAWDDPFNLVIHHQAVNAFAYESVLNRTQLYSPRLKQIELQLMLVDGRIALRRDARKDRLDLVLFAGDRDLRGDLALSSYRENDLVGGVRLEFNRSMDRSGYDAELYQAQLQRGMVLQQKSLHLDDLKYEVAALLRELKDSMHTLRAYRASLHTEQEKLKDAEERYRDGRADTDQLISFENQLSSAELSVASQELDILRLLKHLDILQGAIWRDIELPAYLAFINEEES